MKKKMLFGFATVCCLLLGFSNVKDTKAEIDFSKNSEYYTKICSVKSSYLINKKACDEFEEYKSSSTDVSKMNKSLTDKNIDADKLASLIRENKELVTKKEKQIKETDKKIKDNREKIDKMEKEVLNSLSTMQYFSDENQIIDIITSAVSLDDLMTRIDGLSSINKANIANIYSMEQLSNKLVTEERKMKDDVVKLNETKKKQMEMLLEFRRKEINIYSGKNSGGIGRLNPNIDKLDFSKLEDKSKGWGKPTAQGTITAATWYYTSGGWHPGMDDAVPVGTHVTAPADGAILATGEASTGYGKHIVAVFKKDNYVYTMIFGHLSEFVNVNGFKKGQTIALTGNTGASTGPHTHVEVFRHNTSSIESVVNQFKKNNDYWFGLGYESKGDCTKVCRLQPTEFFNVKLGSTFKA